MKPLHFSKFFCIICILSVFLTGFGCELKNDNEKLNYKDIEYRTDTEPIENRFSYLKGNIDKAYWKTGIIGNSKIGPTSYFITGFITLTDKKFEKEYKFNSVDISFPVGIDPAITGFASFKWGENDEFKKQILGNRFIGDVLYDLENGSAPIRCR